MPVCCWKMKIATQRNAEEAEMSGQSAFPGMSHVLPAFPSPQQLHIPSFSSQHTHLHQIFDLAHHGTAVHTQILGQGRVRHWNFILFRAFFCCQRMQIRHQLFSGAGSGQHINPIRLLSGSKRNHLQQIADHLAVMMAGIFTAFDHMLVINKQDLRLRCRTGIIVLGI